MITVKEKTNEIVNNYFGGEVTLDECYKQLDEIYSPKNILDSASKDELYEMLRRVDMKRNPQNYMVAVGSVRRDNI